MAESESVIKRTIDGINAQKIEEALKKIEKFLKENNPKKHVDHVDEELIKKRLNDCAEEIKEVVDRYDLKGAFVLDEKVSEGIMTLGFIKHYDNQKDDILAIPARFKSLSNTIIED